MAEPIVMHFEPQLERTLAPSYNDSDSWDYCYLHREVAYDDVDALMAHADRWGISGVVPMLDPVSHLTLQLSSGPRVWPVDPDKLDGPFARELVVIVQQISTRPCCQRQGVATQIIKDVEHATRAYLYYLYTLPPTLS
jgi:hypothetical protein